jgi:hypothetical protein
MRARLIYAAVLLTLLLAASTHATLIISSSKGGLPFGGVAWTWGNRIQAENYDLGGNNVGYHQASGCSNTLVTTYRSDANPPFLSTTGDADGASNLKIGCWGVGSWEAYTVNVAASGQYQIDVRLANATGSQATLSVFIDGAATAAATITDAGAAPNYDTFATDTSTDFSIGAGRHTIKIVCSTATGGCGDFNYWTAHAPAAQVISSVSLSNSSFVPPSTVGQVVGNVSVAMSPASPAFTGSLTVTGTDAAKFTSPIVGSQLKLAQAGVGAGTYNINICATQSGISNSPDCQAFLITGSAAPAPAVAAGFTTLLLNSDFTSPAYANTSTWLQCAGANPYIWRLGQFWTSGPCPTIVNDGGVNALLLTYAISTFVSGPSPGNALGISTSEDGCNTGECFPTTGVYEEAVMRWTPLQDRNFNTAPWITNAGAACSVGSINSLEFDMYENQGAAQPPLSDAQFHNCGSPGNGIDGVGHPPGVPANFSVDQYHKYGMRVTSNGTDQVWFCTYIDDVTQGCVQVGIYASDQPMPYTNPGRGGLATTVGTNATSPPNSDSLAYIRRISIWTCPNWQQGGAPCATSNPNP